MPKILLVEDNELNRDMLSRRLQRREFEVVFALDIGLVGRLRFEHRVQQADLRGVEHDQMGGGSNRNQPPLAEVRNTATKGFVSQRQSSSSDFVHDSLSSSFGMSSGSRRDRGVGAWEVSFSLS